MIKGTENIPVGDLIARRVPFIIPKYQRGYAWRKKEEIEDFISDIEILYKLRLKHGQQMKKHFFGGLVSVDRFAANSATGRVFEVVDGQQRLATFLITMSLMEKALNGIAVQAKQVNDVDTESSADAHATQTRKNFLTYEEVDQGKLRERLRLRMSKVDHAYFENLLLTSTKNRPQQGQDSHRKIYDAHLAIEERLFQPIIDTDSLLTPSEKLQHLLTIRTCITDDCHVIFIVSDDRYEAYHLFTTLNDRGRSLGNGDLLRSTTLEMLEGHQVIQDGVEMKWYDILTVKDTDIDKFLHAYFISFAGQHAPRKDLFDYFRKKFFDYQVIPPKLGVTDLEAKSIEERIESMRVLSAIYRKISSGDWPYYSNPSTVDWDRDRLYRLIKILQHTLSIPLLLTIYDQLSEQDFTDVVLMLERFVFRYITIAGAHEGKVSSNSRS